MVAADDWVPSAVKYAGRMPTRRRSGLRLTKRAAMQYCTRSRTMCIAKITRIIFMKAASTEETCPVTVMFRNIQNI